MAEASGASDGAALQLQLQQVSLALPGVRLAMGAERIYDFIDYEAIAALTPQDSAASHLLMSVAGLWSPVNGWPAFIDQQTDLGGCTHLGRLRGALEPVLLHWEAAPQCLREVLHGPIDKVVGQAASTQCFCTDQAATSSDIDGFAALLSAGPLQSAAAQRTLRSKLADPTTRFECQLAQ